MYSVPTLCPHVLLSTLQMFHLLFTIIQLGSLYFLHFTSEEIEAGCLILKPNALHNVTRLICHLSITK